MINVLMYNNLTDRMERHALNLSDPMPYSFARTLTVGEFRGRSTSSIIWTDRRAMIAWNTTRSSWGRPINIGFAFRRIAEGGHANQSQHYAGMAFDVAQNIGNPLRAELRALATRLGVWSYVEPVSISPTWVHFDARLRPPACSAGFPLVRQGARGVYVCTLQDALGAVGIPAVGIDGMFGAITDNAVRVFQRENRLTADGIVGCNTWSRLTSMANGLWRRSAPMSAEAQYEYGCRCW
ncbi:MAG: peptidoglycan-binding protein [Oscillospiraceae bacterium]|nr:peptidoglycan-binding protein [Oscillospiraceae bacterium]